MFPHRRTKTPQPGAVQFYVPPCIGCRDARVPCRRLKDRPKATRCSRCDLRRQKCSRVTKPPGVSNGKRGQDSCSRETIFVPPSPRAQPPSLERSVSVGLIQSRQEELRRELEQHGTAVGTTVLLKCEHRTAQATPSNNRSSNVPGLCESSLGNTIRELESERAKLLAERDRLLVSKRSLEQQYEMQRDELQQSKRTCKFMQRAAREMIEVWRHRVEVMRETDRVMKNAFNKMLEIMPSDEV